ncbi:ABC transporter ATP-binding protein [Haloarculaceae archaeon H-GB1-1]|nr:ABC transporter ATP-binding protein [Haloarculaceae archaeon H-GB1-1]
MAAIELDGVTKRFGDVTALQNVSFTVESGEVFGFLGPNGAGKSTTINILLDFVRPTAGRARIFGMDVNEHSQAIRERTGVLPEGYDVYDRLTGRKHLEFVIDSKDADDDPEEILQRVGLEGGDGDRRAGDYSKGMKQRLVLGMALVDEPDLLVLDEPSTGLDPNGARMMREVVREESERGATVFFSSHILGQVEAVCDRVGILGEGEMIAVDSVEGLRSAADLSATLDVTTAGLTDDAVDAVRSLDGVASVTANDDHLSVAVDDAGKTAVLSALENSGVEVTDFSTEEASLEDLFAAYTGDGHEPGAEVDA